MAAIFQFFRRRAAGKAPPTAVSIKHTFEGHQGAIQSFVFLQDDIHIVSGSDDSTMHKWDCETGQLVGEPWKGEAGILALALSPDGKTIACGRRDGSVQQWDTDGQMKEDIWTGHSDWVLSLSWSPSGSHLASGFDDGTILVRKVESGAVEVGPIKTNQGWVWSVAYSPLGDRIASGGGKTVCIWDSHTGELLVGPIKDLGSGVASVAWSTDGSKLYSASDTFARVFDSASGTLLHRFQHDQLLFSIALSPKHNSLACVGGGTTQLWDTESHRPSHVPLANKEARDLLHVSFSPDGRYLAYGGRDNKITLWTVRDIADPPALPFNLKVSAVNDEQGRNDPYSEFFVPSHSSLPSPSPTPSPRRRLWHISLLHLPINDTMRHKRFTRGVFQRRAEQPQLKGKSEAVNRDDKHPDISSSENVAPGTTGRGNDKGKQRGDPIPDRKPSTPCNLSSPAELDSDENRSLWKSLFRSRKDDNNTAPAKATRDSSPEVVDVYSVRVPKGYIAHKRKHKKKSAPIMTGVQTIAAPEGGSSQAGPSSQPITRHTGQPWQINEASYTDSDSCSASSIQGPFLKFIDKMCFPCGHYEDEDT